MRDLEHLNPTGLESAFNSKNNITTNFTTVERDTHSVTAKT